MKTPKANLPGILRIHDKARSLIATSSLALLLALPAGAATLSFTPDRDTALAGGTFAGDNFGTGELWAGNSTTGTPQRSILSFDVSGLDGLYSSIDSITLTLTLNLYDATLASLTNQVHAVAPANQGWVEGQATWNSRATSTSWAGSVGLGTAGTDYDSTLLSAVSITTGASAGTAYNFTFTGATVALTSLIDAWLVDNVDNAQANPGLLLLDPSAPHASWNRTIWYSDETATQASYKPTLSVNYSAIPEPSAALLGGLGLLALLRRRR